MDIDATNPDAKTVFGLLGSTLQKRRQATLRLTNCLSNHCDRIFLHGSQIGADTQNRVALATTVSKTTPPFWTLSGANENWFDYEDGNGLYYFFGH